MPCTPGLAAPIPELPAPLSLALPTIELPTFELGICCKLPPIPNPLPPIPLPTLVLNPAIVAALNAYIAQALSYIRLRPFECPLE